MKKIYIIIFAVIVLVVISIFYFTKDNDYVVDSHLSDISFDIDDRFEANIYDSSGYYHYYSDDISCNFDVSYYDNYKYNSGNDYLRDMVMFSLNDEVSEIKEIELNGYKWYYMSVDSDGKKSYYYATIKSDKVYELEYDISDYKRGDRTEDESNFCYSEYDKIISSVKLK